MKILITFMAITSLIIPLTANEKVKDEGKNKAFKVLMEAELPENFPEPGPLNKVIMKEYPECRLAKVGNGVSQNFSFMRLFMHIKTNKVAMTTPVIMNLEKDKLERKDMAFVYGKTSIGKTGKRKGGVEVKDLPAKKYISIGMRGYENKDKFELALSKLKDWFKLNPEFKTDGAPRLLGYNSPMVNGSQRYFEVQLPVSFKE
jgi:hypothetical protein